MKLLIIRPEPGAAASAARAAEAGFEPVTLPFFEIRPRPWDAPGAADYDALLVTSANALRHAGSGLASLTGLPVHTVGSQSATAAREAGLKLATAGQSDAAAALVNARQAGHKRLLWLAGEDHVSLELPHGITLDRRIVYASEPLPLDDAAKAMVSACSLVALHSARAAAHFAQAIDDWALPRGQFTLAAFSPAIAEAAGTGWRAIMVADRPEDSALLSAAQSAVKVASGEFTKGESG